MSQSTLSVILTVLLLFVSNHPAPVCSNQTNSSVGNVHNKDSTGQQGLYASMAFFLTITSILTIFYRWSIYLERNEALKSFETIKLAEEHKREQLAKHGLENSHDRAPSFHQLQSSSAAKIKGMVEFTVHDNPKSILSNVKRVVKYFGQIKNNTSVKNDTNMLVNLSDVEVNSSQDQDGLSSHSRCLTIKSLCTVDMIILKPNVNINAIKRSVYQYAMAKSEMQGTQGL